MNADIKMTCGLYIGCGTDFKPTADLKHVRTFIFVDSQPLTPHGDLHQSFTPRDKVEFYNKSYMKDFSLAARAAEFQKISLDGMYPHVYKNFNTNQEVFHYFSLCFPVHSLKMHETANSDEISKLFSRLNQVSHLIVRGYVPHYMIFRYILNPVVFVAYDDTVYSEVIGNLLPYERNKITALLQQNHCRTNVAHYVYVKKNGQQKTLLNYDEFIRETERKK